MTTDDPGPGYSPLPPAPPPPPPPPDLDVPRSDLYDDKPATDPTIFDIWRDVDSERPTFGFKVSAHGASLYLGHRLYRVAVNWEAV